MRVLLCIPSLAGGGTERQLYVLACALKESGVDVHVASSHGGVFEGPLRAAGIPVTIFYPSNNHHPSLLLAMWNLVRRFKPDVIQSFLLQMNVVGGVAAKLHGTPFIFSERLDGRNCGSHWKTLMQRQVAKWANAIVGNSAKGTSYWGGHPNVIQIGNGIPFNAIDGAEKVELPGMRHGRKRHTIMAACRFDPQKNIDLHVTAVAQVLDEISEATAVFLGDGPRLADLRSAFAPWVESERMVFPGYQRQPWGWFKAADIFVSVSHYEGMPNSALEAAACRVPLVLSDIPEHRAIFDDQSAVYCDRSDPRSIAKAIRSVLIDRAAAGERVAMAYNRVVSLTPSNMARQYLKLYCDILGTASNLQSDLEFGAHPSLGQMSPAAGK